MWATQIQVMDKPTATAPERQPPNLATWQATDPTGSGDSDVLIIGDLNSYRSEDPITALKNAGIR